MVALALMALTLARSAFAAQPPTLLNVGHQGRHPSATFVATGADQAIIYVASKPDRATDGNFFRENVEVTDLLSDDEIQSGRWLYEERLDSGTYYVMVRAWTFDCSANPSCIDGFSNVIPLKIPAPPPRYQA